MVGRTISHYEILDKLGEGGMGVVYCARDLRLDRLVALKVLPLEQMVNPQRRDRFFQEARAASALNHPNIITIYEIETIDGVDYIAMEFVRGSTLHELIPPRGMEVALALDYASQTASALAAAHKAGIVHRDIKPANIMITASGLAKLLDFGLARVEQAGVDESAPTGTISPPTLTRPGTVIGTAAYMSPEQAQAKPVDQRSDIFSFGIVLYQMLTGARPFQSNTEIGLMYEVVHAPVPAASRTRVDLPLALDRVLHTAMEKDPARRYPSMEELLADLKEVGHEIDLGKSPKHASGARRLSAKPFWRRPEIIAAAAVALVVLLAVVIWKMSPSWFSRVPAEKKIAVLPFRNVGDNRENEAFCAGVMEALTSELTELSQFQRLLWVVPATEVRREALTSAKDAQRALGVNLVITGSVQRDASHVHLTANLVDALTLRQLRSREITRSLQEVADLQEIVVQEVAGMLQVEFGTRERQAVAAGETGKSGAYDFYLQARGHLQRRNQGDLDQAIELFQKATALDRKYALAYAGLGEAYWRKYRDTQDTQWVAPADKSCQIALSLNSQLAPVYVTLGIIQEGTGHHDEAIKALLKALELEPINANAYGELGKVYEAVTRFKDAESTFQKATQLRPGDWTSLYDLGTFYYRQGRYSQAIPLLQQVTQLAPDNSSGYTGLGVAYWMDGQLENGATSLKKSLELRPTYSAYSSLGTIYFFLDRCAEAVPLMVQASKLAPKNDQVWGNLGDAYACLPGTRDKAPEAYRKAVQLGQERLAVNPNEPEALSVVALYQAKLGEKAKALANIEKARKLAPASRKVAWEAALVYELGGNRDLAIKCLQDALEEGQAVEEVRIEPALVNLRSDKRFAQLMAGRASKIR
jgi:serine/threonine protein kinase/tetratricopeptide (TPR) repeat protein